MPESPASTPDLSAEYRDDYAAAAEEDMVGAEAMPAAEARAAIVAYLARASRKAGSYWVQLEAACEERRRALVALAAGPFDDLVTVAADVARTMADLRAELSAARAALAELPASGDRERLGRCSCPGCEART